MFVPLPVMSSNSQPVKSQYIALTIRCYHNLFRMTMFLIGVTAILFVKESVLSQGSLFSSQEPANGLYVDVLCFPEPSLLGRYTLSIDDK